MEAPEKGVSEELDWVLPALFKRIGALKIIFKEAYIASKIIFKT